MATETLPSSLSGFGGRDEGTTPDDLSTPLQNYIVDGMRMENLSSGMVDSELAAILETMPKDSEKDGDFSLRTSYDENKLSYSKLAFYGETVTSEEDFDADQVEETKKMASLPKRVHYSDVLFVEGREFQIFKDSVDKMLLDESNKETFVTKSRLQQLVDEADEHFQESHRVNIHKLCFDDPTKGQGLLSNELQQVAFQNHVNRRFNRRQTDDASDQPLWYQATVDDIRRNVTSEQPVSFGSQTAQSIPFANVDDALYIPELNPSTKKQSSFLQVDQVATPLVDPSKTSFESEVVWGERLQVNETTYPTFPDFPNGPPLMALSPQMARKQLFPLFESSADARSDDYRLVKLDERFRIAPDKTAMELIIVDQQVTTVSTSLKRLVSKDDTNLLASFTNRLPIKSKSANTKRMSLISEEIVEDLLAETPKSRKRNGADSAKVRNKQRISSAAFLPSKMKPVDKSIKSSSYSNLVDLFTSYGDQDELIVRIEQDYKDAMLEVEKHIELCRLAEQEEKEKEGQEQEQEHDQNRPSSNLSDTAMNENNGKMVEGENGSNVDEVDGVARAETRSATTTIIVLNEDGEIENAVAPESRESGLLGVPERTLVSRIDTVEQQRKMLLPTEAELALWKVRPGRLKKPSRELKSRQLESTKLQWVKRKLTERSTTSTKHSHRSGSCPPSIKKEVKFHKSPFGPRSSSRPGFLDFEDFSKKYGMRFVSPLSYYFDVLFVFHDDEQP